MNLHTAVARALFILMQQKPARGGVMAPRTGRHRRQQGLTDEDRVAMKYAARWDELSPEDQAAMPHLQNYDPRRADKRRTAPADPTRFQPRLRRSDRAV